MHIPNILPAITLALASLGAQAFQVKSLSPQGEVAQIRQLVVRFDESAVNFGDAQSPAPLSLSCSDAQATQGAGRWTSDREWVFDFAADLPPGVACSAQVRPGLRSVKGVDLSGPKTFQFQSGGPFVLNIWPDSSSRIEEDQFFTLQFNGPVALASVLANA